MSIFSSALTRRQTAVNAENQYTSSTLLCEHKSTQVDDQEYGLIK